MRMEPLESAFDESVFGGKASGLAHSLKAGLRVPPGLALDVATVDAMLTSRAADELCRSIVDRFDGSALAVRSSAVGEDSADASFAGQHATLLNVRGPEALLRAIREVRASAYSESALGYRRKLGLDESPRLGIVVQRMVAADRAGVLFTINPVTGTNERVVEATWGLGEAVVAGIVTPDRWTMSRDGTVLDVVHGEKDVEIVADVDGVIERPVEESRVFAPCLDASDLAALATLAGRCDEFFDGPSDLEFAFEAGELFLLQRRAVTTGPVGLNASRASTA